MATSAGPDVLLDGLVFGYDAGYPAADNNKSLRFYNGEPTTNLITNPIPETDTTGFNRSGGTGTISYDSTEKALKWVQTDYSSWGTYLNIYPSFTGTLSTSTQYTLSFEYKTLNAFGDNLISHNLVQGNGQSAAASTGAISNNTSGEINGWKQFSVTFTPSNTGVGTAYNRVITGDRGSDTLTMYIKNIQFEQKSHQTPFVNGTRSSTGALIDLKETADINVSNISFNSTGQPSFDGTDDILNTGLFNGRNPATDPFTIEAIVKSDTTSGARMWLDATSNGTNQRLYCAHAATGTGNPMGIQGTAWGSNGVSDTDFHHYVIVMDGSTATLYNNGVSHSTRSYSSYEIQSLNVGGRNTYNWNGPIPIFKVYDKALSAEEVKQNYNVYRKRFGL